MQAQSSTPGSSNRVVGFRQNKQEQQKPDRGCNRQGQACGLVVTAPGGSLKVVWWDVRRVLGQGQNRGFGIIGRGSYTQKAAKNGAYL
jgi:hypothetical protein